MDLPKDNPRVRELLTQYAVELQNEVPILSRYTDTLTRPDNLGGFAERERDAAMRRNLICPDNSTDLAICVRALRDFRDCGTVWDELRGALLIDGQMGLAAELKERRERRARDLDRMIAEAEALARLVPSTPEELLREIAEDCKTARDDDSGYDFISDMTGEAQPPEDFNPPSEATARYIDLRAWEAAAVRFNHGITGDVDFVEAQIAEYENRYNQNQATYQAAIEAKQAALKAKQAAEQTQRDLADGLDIFCEVNGMKRTPPDPSEVSADFEMQVYERLGRVIKDLPPIHHTKALQTFLEKCTLTYQGWSINDIYKTPDGLRLLKNRCRMRVERDK